MFFYTQIYHIFTISIILIQKKFKNTLHKHLTKGTPRKICRVFFLGLQFSCTGYPCIAVSLAPSLYVVRGVGLVGCGAWLGRSCNLLRFAIWLGGYLCCFVLCVGGVGGWCWFVWIHWRGAA